jgi:hypothetical protein
LFSVLLRLTNKLDTATVIPVTGSAKKNTESKQRNLGLENNLMKADEMGCRCEYEGLLPLRGWRHEKPGMVFPATADS